MTSLLAIVDNGFAIVDTGLGIVDTGFGIVDNGFPIIDNGFGIIDYGLSPITNFGYWKPEIAIPVFNIQNLLLAIIPNPL